MSLNFTTNCDSVLQTKVWIKCGFSDFSSDVKFINNISELPTSWWRLDSPLSPNIYSQ